jgi:hypothetical protein
MSPAIGKGRGTMKFTNREMRIDQIVGYFNQHKINLIPPFQRGTIWPLALRKGLIANIIKCRPIPAIFLYKQADGSQFAYNILDGKQRLESLILFVGNRRSDLKIGDVDEYFFKSKAAKDINFRAPVDGKLTTFAELDDATVRTLREYAIPTIEIDLDDESASIDEIINLFVDINQFGVKVKRFEVVRALGKDKLFNQVLKLIAVVQTRKKSKFYRTKAGSSFVFVLKQLNAVQRTIDNNSQVDRMWERLTDIAMFVRSGNHRRPAEVLDAFIRQTKSNAPLSKDEVKKMRGAFDFLEETYKKHPSVRLGKLATDQSQFYTLITTVLSENLAKRFPDLARRLVDVTALIGGAHPNATVKKYNDLSTRGTADPSRRKERSTLLVKLIESV